MSSFIIRDTLGPAVGLQNQRWALWRRFKKAWPHNKAVYDERMYYYEDGNVVDTVEFKRFCNIIGLRWEEFLEQDYDEIESCWFELKPPTEKDAIFSTTEMYGEMNNDVIRSGTVCTIKFQYGGATGVILPDDKNEIIDTTTILDPGLNFPNDSTTVSYQVSPNMTPEQIQAEIMSAPGLFVMSEKPRQVAGNRSHNYVANDTSYDLQTQFNHTSSQNNKRSNRYIYEKPMCIIACDHQYGWYPLFDDNNTTFTQTSISAVTKIPGSTSKYGYEWTVTYTANKDIEPTDECMIRFADMFNTRPDLPKANGCVPYRVTEKDYRNIYTVNDARMWPNGRLSVPNSDVMKRKEFADLLGSSIDSDYKVEDPTFWEKLAAVVIIIIAVVVAIFSMGSLSGLSVLMVIAAVAWAFAMASLVLAIGSALLGYFGGPSAGNLVRIIGNCAQYVGMIATVLGIVSFVGNLVTKMSSEAIMKAAAKEAKEASAKAATKEAGLAASKKALEEGTKLASSSFINRAVNVSGQVLMDAISFAGDSITQVADKLVTWSSGMFRIYQIYDQNFGEMANMEQEIVDKSDELADLNEENANSKMMVFGMDVYAYSLGSYDAIAELNVKIDQQFGGWKENGDPCAPIT